MKYWIKLYTEILDDRKMGMLSDRLYRRTVEMLALAGEMDEEGLLPVPSDMAWRLRLNDEELETDLVELARVGILDQRDGQWWVTHFSERQAPSPVAKRVAEYRKRKRSDNGVVTDSNDDVTKSYTGNAPEKRREESEKRRGESEKKRQRPLPRTPLEASLDPDIALFKRVSGIFPGIKDYRSVIDAITLLRKTHPDEGDLESYLLPFWLAWDSRKTSDGARYVKTNISWLTEWAVNNYIPDFRADTKIKRKKLVLVEKQAWTPETLAAARATQEQPR